MARRPSISFSRLLALLLPFLTTGCAVGHYYGSISGRVVDKDTAQPLEGAVVVAVYNTSVASAGGPVREFADAQETMTDAQGEFRLPGKFVFHPKIGIGNFEGDPEIYVAKPGYAEYGVTGAHPKVARREVQGHVLYELPVLRSKQERLRWVGWEPGFGRETLPIFMRLYNEERAALGFEPLQERSK